MADDAAHYCKLENMYHAAPINELYGNRIEVGDGAATVRWTVDPRFFHALSALHGSVYFKLLDDAAFFAANSAVTDTFVLTASFHIHFLKPVMEGTVTAKGTLITAGKTLLVAEASLFDEHDRVIGQGSGTFARSRVSLADVPDYKL